MVGRIVADGFRDGVERHVEVFMEDGTPVIEVDYRRIPGEQSRFGLMLEKPSALAGVYYPEPNTLLAAWSILQNDYFDSFVICERIGDIGEIPQPAGKDAVY